MEPSSHGPLLQWLDCTAFKKVSPSLSRKFKISHDTSPYSLAWFFFFFFPLRHKTPQQAKALVEYFLKAGIQWEAGISAKKNIISFWNHEYELWTPLQGIFSQRAYRSLGEYILCVTAINANGVTEKANSVPPFVLMVQKHTGKQTNPTPNK